METSESKNRYYTPSYEEFHYGFKYEISTKESGYTNWKEVECNDGRSLWGPIHDTRFDIKTFKYRVKCLDREDIESLGFELYYYSDEHNTSLFKSDFLKSSISYKWDDMFCCVTSTDPSWYGAVFRGPIKNKSELQWLLKRLGILN